MGLCGDDCVLFVMCAKVLRRMERCEICAIVRDLAS